MSNALLRLALQKGIWEIGHFRIMIQLVLASASPRRREIIRILDLAVTCVSPKAPETRPGPDEAVERYVTRLSLGKAKEVSIQKPSSVVIGADTVVVSAGMILGKPYDIKGATETLQALRGRTHRVVTGLALLDPLTGKADTITRSTTVSMRRYTDDEISEYISRGEPFDKAGGYAIQDPIFNPCVCIQGCYLNVVGLPICDLLTLLRRIGVNATTRIGWTRPYECGDCLIGGAEKVSMS